MSVVNDVLRDLDDRKKNEDSQKSLSFILYGSEPVSTRNKNLLYFIAISIVLLVFGFWLLNEFTIFKYQSLDFSNQVKKEIDTIPIAVDNSPEKIVLLEHTERHQITPQSDNVRKTENETEKKVKVPLSKNNEGLSQAENDSQRVFKASVVAHPKGINDTAHLGTDNEPVIKRVNDSSLEYSNLLISHPEKVYPLIKETDTNFERKPALLALAALAEQKSGRYQSSLFLYGQLMRLEPTEAKWKVGYAINLDKSNKKEQALSLYQESITLPGLPISLKKFAESRIASLLGEDRS